ncbi:MAG: DUF427 domain-containing protein [Pseudomonadota bacterium]
MSSAEHLSGNATLPRENVQSYPRPPALESVPQRVTITLGGVVIADTKHALRVLETHHPPTYYLPPSDIEAKLVPVSGSSFCEWKGVARYFDVVGGSATAVRAAWSYDEPTGPFEPLAGYVAFYPEKMEECRVGEHVAVAQPGSFYGGWVTPNLDGVPKGARGTEHW